MKVCWLVSVFISNKIALHVYNKLINKIRIHLMSHDMCIIDEVQIHTRLSGDVNFQFTVLNTILSRVGVTSLQCLNL